MTITTATPFSDIEKHKETVSKASIENEPKMMGNQTEQTLTELTGRRDVLCRLLSTLSIFSISPKNAEKKSEFVLDA